MTRMPRGRQAGHGGQEKRGWWSAERDEMGVDRQRERFGSMSKDGCGNKRADKEVPSVSIFVTEKHENKGKKAVIYGSMPSQSQPTRCTLV